jgi:4-oxalocrotonate tautomerase
MPMTRVALRKGKPPEYKTAILEQIYEAMRETVHIKDGDRFMSISEHEASEFAYGEAFLDIARTDDLVQIQIFWSPGKTVEIKQAMYRAIVTRLGKAPGIRPEDVFICVFEAAAENWSFGNGETQFYQGS